LQQFRQVNAGAVFFRIQLKRRAESVRFYEIQRIQPVEYTKSEYLSSLMYHIFCFSQIKKRVAMA